MNEALKNEINFYKELAKEIKPNGFRSFLHYGNGSAWLYVITPCNSWLYIDLGEYSGFNISYEYKPSASCGSGCRCNESPLYEITVETLKDAERYGKNFRFNNCGCICKPSLYLNGFEAMKKSYFAKTLIEL